MNDVVVNKPLTDIVISGGGPAGMMAALALGVRGYHTVLLGPETDKTDRRTTALMMPAIRFLEQIGVWAAIEPEAAPFAIHAHRGCNQAPYPQPCGHVPCERD